MNKLKFSEPQDHKISKSVFDRWGGGVGFLQTVRTIKVRDPGTISMPGTD